MHIDYAKKKFYLKSKKKKSHKLFLNIFTYYMEIVHTPQSQSPFLSFKYHQFSLIMVGEFEKIK